MSLLHKNTIADQIEVTDRALTAPELAELLSVSPITVFKQAKAGRILSFRVGTCVRFCPKTVADWLRRAVIDSKFCTSTQQ